MELIKKEAAVAIIEQKQKELSPLGRFSRDAVYEGDRDKFDNWQEIIDAIESIPTIEAEQVVYGEWEKCTDGTAYCSVCGSNERDSYDAVIEECQFCYHCGARMNRGK